MQIARNGKGDASRSALRVALLACEAIGERHRQIEVSCLLAVGRINAEPAWTRPRVIARTARKHTLVWAATAEKHANSGVFAAFTPRAASSLPSPHVTDGPHTRAAETVTVASMTTSVEMVMRGLTRCARYLVPSALVVCVMSVGAPCAAQENVDAPTVPAAPDLRRWTWLTLRAFGLAGDEQPGAETDRSETLWVLHRRLDIPVAQVDLPIRTTKFLTVTPSYMYYSVPASGLNKLPPQPGGFTDSYDEHQFRIDGTVAFAVRKFEISGRNMYVRRFRPAPADDTNRYRGQIAIAHPLAVQGRTWKPFASYETFYEQDADGTESAFGLASRCHSTSACSFSRPTCGRRSEGSRTVDYVLFGLIVNTR